MGLEVAVKYNFAGLIREPLPSGGWRWRVREGGNKKNRIAIHCGPEHPEFQKQYLAARKGMKPDPIKEASDYATPKSIGWLVSLYLEQLERNVEAGGASHKTLKKKRNLLRPLLSVPDKEMVIPTHKLIEMQDARSATPAQADDFISAIRVMYAWALKRKHVKTNTAIGIEPIYKKGDGATPWKAGDVRQYFNHHKVGTPAHIAMSELLWTGCRIEDLTVLGRKFECEIEGLEALRWTPLKKHSTEVIVPLLPPLKQATRAAKVQGVVYLLNRSGRPYSSGDALSATFIRWCKQAGLVGLSAHGVRKGLAELLAGMGCSQYEIMAILGHSEAKTSEVYTRRVERWNLANQALKRVHVSHAWF